MLLPDSKTELVRRGNKVVYDLGDKIVKVFNAVSYTHLTLPTN